MKANEMLAKQTEEVDEILGRIRFNAETGQFGEKSRLASSKSFDAPSLYNDLHRLNEIHKEHRGRNAYWSKSSGYGKSYSGQLVDIHHAMQSLSASKQQLDSANRGDVKKSKVRTDFHNMAKSMDKGTAGDYWSTPHELFARAFESYVFDKMKQDSKHNDFLAHEKHNNHAVYKIFGVKPYPEGEEKQQIDQAFDELFEQLRKHEQNPAPEKMRYSSGPSIGELLAMWTVEQYALLRPTEAQAKAGNYRKSHIRFQGLSITIETPKGQARKTGWPKMPCDYGYIRGTVGNDGDHVDVFVGPNRSSGLVVVIDQINADRKFDEHKVLLGFNNQTEAIACYRKAYTPGWYVGPATTMTISQFKCWLAKGSQKRQVSKQVSKYSLYTSLNEVLA
ncbi:MAG: LPD1 domain-containing protein [Pirellulales bacterium]